MSEGATVMKGSWQHPFSPRRLLTLLALSLVAVVGGAAWAATNGSDVVYNGCYGKDGYLRVVQPGETCKKGDTAISWNQQGPPGAPGVSGPTSLSVGGAQFDNYGTMIASHTVTSAEAGLNLITATADIRDMDGSEGGVTQVLCSVMINGAGEGGIVTLQDTGVSDQGDTASWTLLRRDTLNAGDTVGIRCEKLNTITPGPSGVFAITRLMLVHVDS
jgi:hypothetical protein